VNYTVIISEEAETDIRAIFEYIAFTLLSIQNATKQIARLEEGIFNYVLYPKIYFFILHLKF